MMVKNEITDTSGTENNIYSPEMLKELDKRSKAIRTSLSGIEKSFEKIAFNLYWVYSTKSYLALGYVNIIDYASGEFEFSKSTTYSFIDVVERFCRRDENGKPVLTGFDDKYKGFSSSKLSLLTELADNEIEELEIVPEMSVNDIKKKIKRAKEGYEKILISSKKSIGLPERNSNSVSGADAELEDSKNTEIIDNPDSDSNEPDDSDTDGVIGYTLTNIFSFKPHSLADRMELFPSDEVLKSCINALELYKDLDPSIEINCRYAVKK